MTFHITYKASLPQRDDIQDRFKKTGAPPPSGVTMKSRWHSINGNKGFIIAESDDLEVLGRWIQEWSDLIAFEVIPVLSDEQIGRIIS